MKLILIPSLLLMFVGCTTSTNDTAQEELPPVIDCSTVQSVPKFAEVQAFQTVCTTCHSTTKTGAERQGAPTEVNFDDYASASAHAEQAAIEVNVGAMPPDFAGLSLTETQERALFHWAMCGAPR